MVYEISKEYETMGNHQLNDFLNINYNHTINITFILLYVIIIL